jgi:hypothetical protein
VNTLASMMKRLKYRASCRQCQCEKDVSPWKLSTWKHTYVYMDILHYFQLFKNISVVKFYKKNHEITEDLAYKWGHTEIPNI